MNAKINSNVTPVFIAGLKIMSISKLAAIIRKDWGVRVNYAAEPYLSAMSCLNNITDKYWYDDARSIISYFLANASSWRGEMAKVVKAELRSRIK